MNYKKCKSIRLCNSSVPLSCNLSVPLLCNSSVPYVPLLLFQIFPLLLAHISDVVWQAITSSQNLMRCENRPLLSLALLILSNAPAFSEWCFQLPPSETKNSLSNCLPRIAELLTEENVVGRRVSETTRQGSGGLMGESLVGVSVDEDSLIEDLSQIDLLTFAISLASPLMVLLAENALSSVQIERCGEYDHRDLGQGQLGQGQLGRGLGPIGGTVPINISAEEVLGDEETTFFVDLLDSRLVNPCLELIDAVLGPGFGQQTDSGADDAENGSRKGIRKILMGFPKSIPAELRRDKSKRSLGQSPVNLSRISVCHNSIGTSDWDSVNPSDDITLCLTPVLHYLSVRQFLDVFLGMKVLEKTIICRCQTNVSIQYFEFSGFSNFQYFKFSIF